MTEMRVLPAEEVELFTRFCGEEVSSIATFRRLSVDGEVFFCRHYSRVKRRNSFTVTYKGKNGDVNLGQIEYFAIRKKQPTALMAKIEKLTPCFPYTKSVYPVTFTHNLEVIHAQAILHKVIFISLQSATYIAEFPSNLNSD